jgi:chromosome segregation ATPase
MTDSLGSNLHALDVTDAAFARREWELRERIDELRAELTERLERERIRELELMSQRHELEVRFAYNAMLEERVVDHVKQIEWLHKHAEGEAERFAVEHRRIAAEHQRVVSELESRYAELAADYATLHENADGLRRAWEDTQHERDALRSELDAERGRLSNRIARRLAAHVRKHPFLSSVVRRAARVFSR